MYDVMQMVSIFYLFFLSCYRVLMSRVCVNEKNKISCNVVFTLNKIVKQNYVVLCYVKIV